MHRPRRLIAAPAAAPALALALLLGACAGTDFESRVEGFTGVDGEFYLINGVCFRNDSEGEPTRRAPIGCAHLLAEAEEE